MSWPPQFVPREFFSFKDYQVPILHMKTPLMVKSLALVQTSNGFMWFEKFNIVEDESLLDLSPIKKHYLFQEVCQGGFATYEDPLMNFLQKFAKPKKNSFGHDWPFPMSYGLQFSWVETNSHLRQHMPKEVHIFLSEFSFCSISKKNGFLKFP